MYYEDHHCCPSESDNIVPSLLPCPHHGEKDEPIVYRSVHHANATPLRSEFDELARNDHLFGKFF